MSKRYTIYIEDEKNSLLTLSATLSIESINKLKSSLQELIKEAEL